ncbi:MAG: hypothetical protein HC889_07700 [Synechococcaceae cyanobacterium SM1_2_3]|nr:hypothetical protein [Synechococcaceae cyanobacterium SM1_2_3]
MMCLLSSFTLTALSLTLALNAGNTRTITAAPAADGGRHPAGGCRGADAAEGSIRQIVGWE